ncbi:unnamed protein product [Bursaphelenchus xylophilus]|uniref:(pine wood nematode) hypothetical protein n=1 Tax=Bursaphelenchus xylophilus TaxID=6326 RepID=A0A7I8XIV9_BURXY|nr:unnamed protein product [Bursaphelenchus xylophilus]CAG9125346.1 unnamed protein product [Bursaphelenchus xylophilus]
MLRCGTEDYTLAKRPKGLTNLIIISTTNPHYKERCSLICPASQQSIEVSGELKTIEDTFGKAWDHSSIWSKPASSVPVLDIIAELPQWLMGQDILHSYDNKEDTPPQIYPKSILQILRHRSSLTSQLSPTPPSACQPSPETTKSMESPKISRKSASSAPAVNITHGSVSGTKPHIRSLAGSRFSDSASDHIWQEIAQNHTKCQRCPTRAHHILLCPRLTEDEQASLRETFNRLLQERYH